jgi:hypothetical protein
MYIVANTRVITLRGTLHSRSRHRADSNEQIGETNEMSMNEIKNNPEFQRRERKVGPKRSMTSSKNE